MRFRFRRSLPPAIWAIEKKMERAIDDRRAAMGEPVPRTRERIAPAFWPLRRLAAGTASRLQFAIGLSEPVRSPHTISYVATASATDPSTRHSTDARTF